MIKGNEKDCICEKPNGKHRKYCDAYLLKEFMGKGAGILIRGGKLKKSNPPSEE